jgi:type II secretory pathway predicted ATPase ExeA
MKFTKATRQKARLRLALTGPSGSGKTWGALLLAAGLGGKIAVIDTERESASLYSHLTEFDTLNLGAPFTPERYIEAIKAAEAGRLRDAHHRQHHPRVERRRRLPGDGRPDRPRQIQGQ